MTERLGEEPPDHPGMWGKGREEKRRRVPCLQMVKVGLSPD